MEWHLGLWTVCLFVPECWDGLFFYNPFGLAAKVALSWLDFVHIKPVWGGSITMNGMCAPGLWAYYNRIATLCCNMSGNRMPNSLNLALGLTGSLGLVIQFIMARFSPGVVLVISPRRKGWHVMTLLLCQIVCSCCVRLV